MSRNSMRRRRQPSTYMLCLPQLGAANHPVGARALLSAFIQHLVFAREQCHAPYAQLAALAAEHAARTSQRPRCGGAALRRVLKYQQQLSTLLRLVAEIPDAAFAGGSVALLLGSSPTRPREVYVLTFPAGLQTDANVPPPGASVLAEASRRLLRTLVVEGQAIKEWDVAPGPTKLYLMFQAPLPSDRGDELSACPPGFAPRRGFCINLRRAFQVDIQLGAAKQLDQTDTGQRRQQQQDVSDQTQPHSRDCSAAEEGLSRAMCSQMSLQEQQQQPQGHDALDTMGCMLPAAAPDLELLWYCCTLHVKGLRARAG